MSKVQAAKRKPGLIKKRGDKVGAAPGTLLHVGDISNPLTEIHYIRYDQDAVHEQEITDVQHCAHDQKMQQTGWINIDGLHNSDVIRSLGERFLLHPLVQEDILNTDHRPKIEVHDDYLYLVIKALSFNETSQRLQALAGFIKTQRLDDKIKIIIVNFDFGTVISVKNIFLHQRVK